MGKEILDLVLEWIQKLVSRPSALGTWEAGLGWKKGEPQAYGWCWFLWPVCPLASSRGSCVSWVWI